MLDCKILVFAIAISVTSCAVTVPDVPLCVGLTPDRGHCIHTMTSREFEVSDSKLYEGQTWWEMKYKSIVMPAKSWARIKTFIIQVCTKTKKCNEQLSSWDRTVEGIDKAVSND